MKKIAVTFRLNTCTWLLTIAAFTCLINCSETNNTSVTHEYSEWPTAYNRGIPEGTVLTNFGTPGQVLTVTEDGAVFDGLNILSSGQYFDINVMADNVTFRNCRYGNIVIGYGQGGYTNLLIEDCESTVNGCGGPAEYTIRRCYIHPAGDGDGPRIVGSNVIIEDNYIQIAGGNHFDCIQALDVSPGVQSTNVIIRHNTLENAGHATSCINVTGRNFLIENNLMAGAGFTIYTSAEVTHMQVINNRFSTKFYQDCGYFGLLYNPWNSSGEGNQWSGNVWHETGLPCDPVNP